MDRLEMYYDEMNEALAEAVEDYDILDADSFVRGYRAGYYAGLDRGMELEHEALLNVVDKG